MADMSATMLEPLVDPDSAFYWAGLREGRFLVQRCAACRRGRFPPMPSCPFCAATDVEVIEPSGHGRVYSWIVVRRALKPAFRSEVPYVIATVDLDEGVRMIGRLEGAEPAADLPVRIVLEPHATWTEPRFRPLDGDQDEGRGGSRA